MKTPEEFFALWNKSVERRKTVYFPHGYIFADYFIIEPSTYDGSIFITLKIEEGDNKTIQTGYIALDDVTGVS